MIRILLVDDHNLVRAGLQRVLEHADDFEVVAAVANGEEATRVDLDLLPDVVLMDLSMPGMSGVEATRQICAARPTAVVVILTAAVSKDGVNEALDAGAVGYLVKDSEPSVVIDGVRAAAEGGAPLDARVARALLDKRSGAQDRPCLTERETEVVRLVGEGLANKAIARKLGISDKTVKAHLTKIFAELGVNDRYQAALWVKEHL